MMLGASYMAIHRACGVEPAAMCCVLCAGHGARDTAMHPSHHTKTLPSPRLALKWAVGMRAWAA